MKYTNETTVWGFGLVRTGLLSMGLSFLALSGWQVSFLVGVFLVGLGVGLGDWKGVNK